MTAIWWIRRDLRLHDNTALHSALVRGAGAVIPVYIIDPDIEHSTSHRGATRRRAFLLAGLE